MADKAASNEFEDVREFAERIGVIESTIRRMCDRGELTCCRFGNRWRINRDALLAYAGLE